MIKILIYILLIYIVYKVFRSLMTPSGSSATKSDGGTGSFDDIMIKDPVCEVYFPKKDGIYLNDNGNEIYFCSKECRDKFLDLQSKK
jgi:YHS domain-containing protein